MASEASSGSKVPESVKNLIDELEGKDEGSLAIHYPDLNITKPGTKVEGSQVASAPTLSLGEHVSKSASTKYLLIVLDVDPPFPSLPLLGPLVHALETDLQATGGPTPDGGRLALKSDVVPVVPYLKPTPPPGSAPHRYVFLVWEQPQGQTAQKIREALEVPVDPGMAARIRWDEETAERKIGLGKPLAGNYFLC